MERSLLSEVRGDSFPCRGPQDVLAEYCPVLPAWPALPWTLLVYALRPDKCEISDWHTTYGALISKEFQWPWVGTASSHPAALHAASASIQILNTRDTLLKMFCRNRILLSSALRPAFIADGLTFHNVPIFATRFTLSQNFAASIINEGFGTLNFDVGVALTPAAY